MLVIDLKTIPSLSFHDQKIQKSMDWLLSIESEIEMGFHYFDDSGCFVHIHEYYTKLEEDCIWESHAHTIDIQFVLKGEEYVDFSKKNSSFALSKKYIDIDRSDWREIRESKVSRFMLNSENVGIFFPNELHRPMIYTCESAYLKKGVIKIPI
jgi:YhcH/YjgK/YiaL family protein